MNNVTAVIVVLLMGLGSGTYVGIAMGAADTDRLRSEWTAERDSLSGVVAALEQDALRARERADSLESVARASTDTVRSYITRWRTRTDTLTVTQVVALADSTVAACEVAVDDCERALSAADSARSAQVRVTFAEAERADVAEANWRAALDRIEREGRWERIENIALLAGGFLAGYLAGK